MFKQPNCYLLRQSGFSSGQIKMAFKEYEALDLKGFEDEFVKGIIFKKRELIHPAAEDILRWRPKKGVVEALGREGYERSYIDQEAKHWASQFVLSDMTLVVNLSAAFKKWFLAKHTNIFSVEVFCKGYKSNNPKAEENRITKMALTELFIEWEGRGRKSLYTWERLFLSKLDLCSLE